jgi:hypothetical protein
VALIGEERKIYKVLLRKLEGNSLLRKPRGRWQNGTKIGLRGIGCGRCEVDSGASE